MSRRTLTYNLNIVSFVASTCFKTVGLIRQTRLHGLLWEANKNKYQTWIPNVVCKSCIGPLILLANKQKATFE